MSLKRMTPPILISFRSIKPLISCLALLRMILKKATKSKLPFSNLPLIMKMTCQMKTVMILSNSL